MTPFLRQILIFVCLFISGCSYFHKAPPQILYKVLIEGPNDAKVTVFRINTNEEELKYNYVTQVSGGQSVSIPAGKYFFENECSNYETTITSDKTLILSYLRLKVDESIRNSNDFYTHVSCKSKATQSVKTLHRNRFFYMLPGDTKISVAGKNFLVKAPEDTSKRFFIPLYPFHLYSSSDDRSTYFLHEIRKTKNTQSANPLLVPNTVNQTIWLPKTQFEVEINGSKSLIDIQDNQMTTGTLGGIKVFSPKQFDNMDKLALIHSPTFAYLNDSSLLQLNRTYSVFPQEYKINLGHSKIEKNITVNPGKIATLQTYGAQINPPNCYESEQEKCFFTQKVLIHKDFDSEVLLKAPLGEPILVFDGDYQYSIEGSEGIMKRLNKSVVSVSQDRIGELNLKWEVNISTQKLETQKIEIESRDFNVSGKSKDINSYKPKRILLPSGQYRVIYSLRQEKGLLSKKTTFTNIYQTRNNKIVVPIYAQSDQNLDVFLQTSEDEVQEGPSTLIPITP